MTIVWPDDTADVIDDIRDAIGRDIVLYRTVSGIACPTPGCDLDPVTGLSTDQFCAVCGGEYWLSTASGITIKAHVFDRTLDVPVWTAGGLIVDGDISAQIKYTVTNLDAVENAEYYEVDGKEFIQKSFSLRGVPDLNRIVIALIEKEG